MTNFKRVVVGIRTKAASFYKQYDFSQDPNYDQLMNEFSNLGIVTDGSFNFVTLGDIAIGKKLYYIGVDGNKEPFQFSFSITDQNGNTILLNNGVIESISELFVPEYIGQFIPVKGSFSGLLLEGDYLESIDGPYIELDIVANS